MEKIELGTFVRDSRTGFHGIAMSRCEYLHAIPRVCVQPVCGDDGKMPKLAWIDEPDLLLEVE